jgi:flagellar M-ring protein FliF
VLGFLVFLLLYNSRKGEDIDGYAVLFDKVTAEDSALIIQQLEKDGVEYKVVNENTIKVPQEQVYKERIAIAALGIPKSSKVGFELFDKQEFGATDFDQQVKYLRAIEGELARTIEILKPIESAAVHIALPKETVFVEAQVDPTASVVIQLKPGKRISSKQIVGIKNLISASIPKLLPENVKITDANGEPLGEDDALFDGEVVKAQIKYKQDYELEYEEKIVNVLSPFIGGDDKVVAKVNIDYSFDQKEKTSEVYDPNAVARSEQSLEEKREGKGPKEIGGVPGAVSNIGPVEGLELNQGSEKYQKSTVTTNYEISKEVSSVKGSFATIKRITAAVVVDGDYKFKKDADGNPTAEVEYVKLDPAKLDQISAIVKQTIGFDQERGDEVTISNFEFKHQPPPKKPVTQDFVEEMIFYLSPIIPVIKYMFVILILLVLYKKVIVPFSQKMLEVAEEEKVEEEMAELDDEEDTLEKFRKAKEKVRDQIGISSDMDEEELRYDILLEKIREIVEERPEDVAALLESLIKEETGMDYKDL